MADTTGEAPMDDLKVALFKGIAARKAGEGNAGLTLANPAPETTPQAPPADSSGQQHTPAPGSAPAGGEEPEQIVDTPAYSFLRGIRDRALHLKLKPRRGDGHSPSYAMLHDVIWLDPEGESEPLLRGEAFRLLFTSGLEVTIEGVILTPLHDRLLRHQVVRITEMGEDSARFLPEGTTVVYRIKAVMRQKE
jgi:hypothetical protein